MLETAIRQELLFHAPTEAKERIPLAGLKFFGLTNEFDLQVLRQRQIHVVAAEKQMVADGDAMKLDLAVGSPSNADQSEIGCAAADVANQNFLAGRNKLLPVVLMLVNPGIKRGLRLFNQHHFGQAGPCGGLDGQFASDFIERCRQSKNDVLPLQRLALELVVPGRADVCQIPAARFDRRNPLDIAGRMPGQ